MGRCTLIDGGFELVNHVEVKLVGDGRVIGSTMFDLNWSALIRWSAQNSQVSLTQFEERERTGVNQTQGLSILANFGKPKVTVGA